MARVYWRHDEADMDRPEGGRAVTPPEGADRRLRVLARGFEALAVPISTPGEGDPRKPDRPDAVAMNLAQADVLLTRIAGLAGAVEAAGDSKDWDDVDTFLARALTADLAFLAANFRWLGFMAADQLRLARRDLDDVAAALEAAGGLPSKEAAPNS